MDELLGALLVRNHAHRKFSTTANAHRLGECFKNVLEGGEGAGGAARAVVCALSNLNGDIFIYNRTLEKALKIQQDLGIQSEVVEQENLSTIIGEISFIVNTTSLGLDDTENTTVDFTQANPQAFVYDLIYNPKLTKFLSAAKERNLGFQNGMKMLIEQAAESFKIWHNIHPQNSTELMNVLEEL